MIGGCKPRTGNRFVRLVYEGNCPVDTTGPVGVTQHADFIWLGLKKIPAVAVEVEEDGNRAVRFLPRLLCEL